MALSCVIRLEMRQADEDRVGASSIVRVGGVEAGESSAPRFGGRGLRYSKQHPRIEKVNAGVVMRGRTP